MRAKIPSFKSPEEALFWESHDITQLIDPDEFRVVTPRKAKTRKARAVPAKTLISIRIESTLVARAKKLAHKCQENDQSILRKWLNKGAG